MIPVKWWGIMVRIILRAYPLFWFRNALVLLHSRVMKIKRRRQWKKTHIKVPGSIFLEITKKCNMRCKGCIADDASMALYELSDKKIRLLIEEAVYLGVNSIIFLGGEPMTRFDLVEGIVKSYPYLNFNIVTNGALIDDQIISRLKRIPNLLLFISVDGDEPLHDSRRGIGSYAQATCVMDRLYQRGIPYVVNCTTTKENLEIVTSVEYANHMKTIGAYMLLLLPYLSTGCSADEHYCLSLSDSKVIHQCIDIVNRSLEGFFVFDVFDLELKFGGCRAVDRSIMINVVGDVTPCPALMFSGSNVKSTSLSECLSVSLLEKIRSIKDESCGCILMQKRKDIKEIVEIENAKITAPMFSTIMQKGFFPESIQ